MAIVLKVILYAGLLHNLCILVKSEIDRYDALQSNITLKINNVGEIKSEEFPQRCCSYLAEIFTLKTEVGGYIHLVFDDLDLPLGSIFKIYSDEDENEIYPSQAVYKFGAWQRPFISSKSPSNMIRIMLRAPEPSVSYNTSRYAGFKASYYVSTDEEPRKSYTSDLCGSVIGVKHGEVIRVKPKPINRLEGLWLDCLWVLKPPNPTNRVPNSEVVVYIRIAVAEDIREGFLKIRNGTSSDSTLLATESLSDQPPEGYTSNNGFYVRAVIPADDKHNRFSFVYGYIQKLTEMHNSVRCVRNKGFLCSPPYGDWCLPKSHVCNYIQNCPDGSDEQECDDLLPDTRLVTPTLVTTSTTTSIVPTTTEEEVLDSTACNYYHQCDDGRCLFFEHHCDTNIGKNGCYRLDQYCETSGTCVSMFDKCPGDCSYDEKKCQNGDCVQFYNVCPSETCLSPTPKKCPDMQTCYSQHDECDGVDDCPDSFDERGCSLDDILDSSMFWFILIPFGVVTFCLVLCVQIHQKSNRNRADTSGQNSVQLQAVDVNRSTPALSAPLVVATTPQSTDNTRDNNYNTGNVNNTQETEDQPLAPPPAYEEVALNEPPPPTYESALHGAST